MPSSPFAPASPEAQAISNIFIVTLVAAAFVLGIVVFGTVYAIIRYRNRPGAAEPEPQFGIRKLEIAWTVGPAVILAALLGYTLSVMVAIQAPARANQQPDLIVIGHQWWWEYRYPKQGFETANEAHIPVGKKLLVQVLSADVIHDFWVPNLARKIDAIPGKTDNYIYLQADQPGLYLGTCAEYCGAQHAWMRIRVYADDTATFDAWAKQQSTIPTTPTTGAAAVGAQLFQSVACAACHTIAGTSARGVVGPNLTHVADRQTLVTGILQNSPASLAAWISDPQGIKPGNHMPKLQLTGEQISSLVSYLEALK